MKYVDEVHKAQQITLNEFRFLPGSRLKRRWNNDYYDAVVREVWSANPEFVLGSPGDEEGRAVRWAEKDREDCNAFLRGGHLPVKIRLKKSMWAMIDVYLPGFSAERPHHEILYTYDIEEFVKNGNLIVVQQ